MGDRDPRAWPKSKPFTEAAEGGWANVKGDRGLETYCGMSRRAHPRHPIWKTLDARRPHRHGQVYDDLKPVMEKFYREEYFEAVGGHLLPASLALPVYDWGVISGTRRSARKLQKAVGAKEDGKVGPNTIKAVDREIAKRARRRPTRSADLNNLRGERSLALTLIDSRLVFFVGIIRRRPSQLKFLLGWMRRLIRLVVAIHTR
jgi:lysozyme family protein